MFRPVSIRINILTHFFLVIFFIAASLLGLQYYFGQKLASSAAHKNFSEAAHKITQHMQSMDQMSKNRLYYAEQYPYLSLPPDNEKHLETIKRFTNNIQQSPNLYAMYLGYDNGDFLEVINMKLSTELFTHFKAPEDTRWTIIRIFNSQSKRLKHYEYYNQNLELISKRQEDTDYYANKRPWFIQAFHSEQAIRTDAYTFSNLNRKGITFAKRIADSNVVIALDFTLNKLNELLQSLSETPSHEISILTHDGEIIASSVSKSSTKKSITSQFQLLQQYQSEQLIEHKFNNIRKFSLMTVLSSESGNDTYLVFSIDANVILSPYLKQILYAIVVAIIFLIISIPFILYMTSHIVQPIKNLMQQNNKIKQRKFDEITPIETNIIELEELSDSLLSMSQSIRDFQVAQQELMDSFIRLIADAIDAKSSYTGGHCQRVPEIAMMLAKEASDTNTGIFQDFCLDNPDAWREFEIGAWLHDCGKVTTPEYVVDKATKLETIHNRIHEIRTRFEVLWRDIEIQYYQRLLQKEDPKELESWKNNTLETLQDDFAFIAQTNIGGEYMSEEKKERVARIARQTWIRHFNDRAGLSNDELSRYEGIEEQTLPATEYLLSDKPEHIIKRANFNEQDYRQQGFKLEVPEHQYNYGEIYNLCIEKGTLTEEERFKINEHVIMSIKMLELLPYPEHMKRIPEYAGTHHETMIGTGYPRKLSRKDLSIPARIMAIADIFEALTASDRPYKKGKTLSEAIRIMTFMKNDQHIDADIFKLFISSGIYKDYAEKYLKPEQVDEIDPKLVNEL